MQKKSAPRGEAVTGFSNVNKISPLNKFGHKRIKPFSSATKNRTVILPQACYKSVENPDKAMIKVVVTMDWEDGTGYQVLLDDKHEIVSYVNDKDQLDQTAIDEIYAAATSKIPADAQPEIGGSSIVADSEHPVAVDSAYIEPGTYDLLFVNPSPDYDDPEIMLVYLANNGYFDDIVFEAGTTYVFTIAQAGSGDYVTLIPKYDLAATKLELPVGNCAATEAEVAIEITNNGAATIDSCTVFYTVKGMDGTASADTVKEKIRIDLALGESRKHVFSAKLAFTQDTVLTVVGGIYPVGSETETGNNYIENIVVRKSAVQVPYSFDLSAYDVTYNQNDWEIMEGDGIVALGNYAVAAPAITRCISMEADESCRFSFDYMAGFSFFGFEFSATFGVKFGKAGTDVSTWETVLFEEDVFVEDFDTKSIAVTAKEAGEYAFCFFEDTTSMGGGIIIARLSIGEIHDYDVKMKDFVAGMPRITPVEQAEATFKGNFTITNWGRKAIDKAVVTISMNGRELVKKDVVLGAAGTEKKEAFDLPVSGLKANDEVEFTATVAIDSNDADLANNRLTSNVEISDVVMAYDHVTEDMYTNDYAIGASSGNIGCGIPFTINRKDTLTAVSAGWSERSEDMEILIAVNRWNAGNETLGDLLFQNTYRRGTDAGQREYAIPALLLEPGDYILSVHQRGTSYGLICDGKPSGALYIVTNDPATKQTNLGTPAIRAIFGHDGKPMAKDLAVLEISSPKETGLFTNEEPIVVRVRNNGYEAAQAPLSVLVNKTALPVQNVNLPAYAEAEFTFKGDLSASDAEFLLTAFTALQGDEDMQNDTCFKTVHSLPAASPYVMNFEYGEDFAIADEFVPAWKGIDMSGAYYQYGFNVSYPHRQEPVGFMSFPNGTTTLTAYEGERFGIVFGSGDQNDQPLESNAWLISPKLQLPAATAGVSFHVKSATVEYGFEKYNVLVSVTDNKPESFVKVGGTREAPAEWTAVNVDLAEYAGKEVHVAIQCVSFDAFAFMIDNIVVGGGVGNEVASNAVRVTVYPNPASEMILVNADQAIEQVAIFQVTGNMIYNSPDKMNTEEFRYNVSGLAPGIYLARVKTAQGYGVVKFMVR